MFRLPRGGRVRFRPLENVQDAEKYQGQNVTDAAVEEAGNYPDSAPIDMLFGCLRSRAGVPVQLILTANPGGPGHHWIKRRYVDPAPMGMQILKRALGNGALHPYTYIPSRVQNNRILLARDPDYVSRLHLVGSETLVRAWLEGDWGVIAGAYFELWDLSRHVLPMMAPPASWRRFRAMDWGSAAPFSIGWYAVSQGDLPFPRGHRYAGEMIPRGALLRYREWYGMAPDQPNVGLKLHASRVAEGVLARNGTDAVDYTVADPSMFIENGGPSLAESFRKHGVALRAADNRRLPGWDQVRWRLQGEHAEQGREGPPMLLVTENCGELIRTLPALQHDSHDAEDVDSAQEDHAADELRYACMSRPRTRTPAAERGGPKYGTFDWLVSGEGCGKRSIYRLYQSK